VTQPCSDFDSKPPEEYAGADTDDGWDEPIGDEREVTDGRLDSGAVPGQPQD
jgi:hypothetical protein